MLATYSASAAFTIDTTLLSGALKIGLLNPVASGSAFDLLSFNIFENDAAVLMQEFSSLTAAMLFFHDNVLDLGPVTPDGSSTLHLRFEFNLTGHVPDAAFNTDFLIAAVGVGPRVNEVPEPGTALFLATGFVGLLTYRWQRQRHAG
jgi:hypothetical protein